jgi:hypothetical protein
MTQPLAVNQVLDRLTELNGMPVEIEGILERGYGGYSIAHYPKAQGRDRHIDGAMTYKANIEVRFGEGSIQPTITVLARWLWKRVRIHGQIQVNLLPQHYATVDSFANFSPAWIEPYSIQRVTADQRRDHRAQHLDGTDE